MLRLQGSLKSRLPLLRFDWASAHAQHREGSSGPMFSKDDGSGERRECGLGSPHCILPLAKKKKNLFIPRIIEWLCDL